MRGSILFRILGALLIIGILVAAGVFIFQAGQAQGYALGLTAAGKDGATTPAPLPYYGYGYGLGFHPFFFPFFPLGGLLFIFGLFFLLSFVFGGFRRRYWYHHQGGWYGGPNPWGPNPQQGQPGQQPGQPGPGAGPQNQSQ